MDHKIAVAIVSRSVGKTPQDIGYSFVFDEAYRLSMKGVNVHMIRSRFEKDSLSYGMHFHGLGRKVDLQAIRLALSNFHVYPPTSLLRNPAVIYWENLYASNVSRVVEKNSIDLLHAHFAYPEGLIAVLAKRMRRPLVVTIHGYDILLEPTVRYGVRFNKRIDAIISSVLSDADAVIAPSKAMFNEVRKIADIDDKLHLIPNGVDIQRFNPNLDGSGIRKKLRIKGRIIFTLRAHQPKNGLEYLIRAAPMVIRDNEDVVFVIGGDGPLRHYHERLADRLGVKERIMFTGKIPQCETPYYYAMSDIVVVPSLQEGFGLVVSEAMACGKPVVGTNAGGIPDQIVDGHNGFLVEPRNSVDIAKKILWLINNPNEARLMGVNGRKTVEEKFNIGQRIDKIIQLYKMLIE